MLGIISLPQHRVPKETDSKALRLLCKIYCRVALETHPRECVREGETRQRSGTVVWLQQRPQLTPRGGRHGTWVALQSPSRWRQAGWDFVPLPGPVVACGLPQSGVRASGEVAPFGRGRFLKTGCALHWGNEG